MPLPATISASLSWPDWKNAHCGPFQVGGNLYVVGVDKTNNHAEIWKSTDGGDTWAEQDAANHKAISTTADTKSAAACVDGTDIAVAYANNANGWTVTKFSTATDTWGTAGPTGNLPVNDGLTGAAPIALARRGADDYVACYQVAAESIMGTAYRRISARPFSAGAWGTAVHVETGVQAHQDLGGIVAGSSGRVHIFWRDATNNDLKHRSFLSNNTFGTVQVLDATIHTTAAYPIGIPASYVEGANTDVMLPYLETTLALTMVRAPSADGLSFGLEQVSTAQNPEFTNANLGAATADVVGGVATEYAFWFNDADQDLYRRPRAGSWGIQTEHRDAITGQGINVSSITNALGILYSDAGTVKYDSLVLASPPNTTIDSGPAEGSTSDDTTPTFTFSSDDPSATFEVQIDGGSWTAQTSPWTPTLSYAAHTVGVRAVNTAGPDATPATRSFTILALPDTTITAGPGEGSTISDTTPTFEFTSDDPGATFESNLDGAGWVARTSPYTTGELSQASHTVQIRAVNASGVDATPDSRTFTVEVDNSPRVVTILSGPTSSKISRVPGKDSTDIEWSSSGDFDAYQIRLVDSISATQTEGTLLESGGGGSTSTPITSTITDDELVTAIGSELNGSKLLKIFVQANGVWSDA